MRRIILAFICLFILCSLVYAGDDDGYYWNTQSLVGKQILFIGMAVQSSDEYVNDSKNMDDIIKQIDAIYATSDPKLLNMKIQEVFDKVLANSKKESHQKK